MKATFGYDKNGSWYVVVYRGDVLVARSPDYSIRLAAEKWALDNYPEAEWGVAWKRRKDNAMNVEQFNTMAKEIKLQVEANLNLRAALLPFAAAAGRPGRLSDCMTDKPLSDDAVLALGIKVSAWKRAIELTGADDLPDCAFASPEDPRFEALGDNTAKRLTCANCGEVSTNPGQFTPDGLWVCTEACRTELYVSLAANGGVPQDEDTKPHVSGNDKGVTT